MRSTLSPTRPSPAGPLATAKSSVRSGNSSPEHATNTPDSVRRRIFALLFVLMSLDVIGFAAILPLFPSILNHFDTYDREVFWFTLLCFSFFLIYL